MTTALIFVAGFYIGFTLGYLIAYKVSCKVMNKKSGGKIVFSEYPQGIDMYVEFPNEDTLNSVRHRTYAVFEIDNKVSH